MIQITNITYIWSTNAFTTTYKLIFNCFQIIVLFKWCLYKVFCCLKYEWQIEIILLCLDAFKKSSEPNDHLGALSWFLSVGHFQALSKYFNSVWKYKIWIKTRIWIMTNWGFGLKIHCIQYTKSSPVLFCLHCFKNMFIGIVSCSMVLNKFVMFHYSS